MNALQIAEIIIYYLYPVVALIGLLFNSLTFILFSRKRFKNTIFWIYFRFLLIFDSLSMFLPVNKFLEQVFDIYIRIISSFLCKFRYFYIYSVYPVSGWTLAIVSIDRFLSISYPNRFVIRKKVSFQIVACISIMSFNFIYYSPNLFFKFIEIEEFDNETNQTDVYYRCRNPGIPLDLMDLIGSTLIPFLIMILFTSFTLVSLFKMRKNSLQMNKTRSKDKRFAIVTITVNFVFLAFNIPYGIYQNFKEHFEPSDLKSLFASICSLMLYFNSSSQFILNILVNSIFRNEFMNIVCIKRQKNDQSNIKLTFT